MSRREVRVCGPTGHMRGESALIRARAATGLYWLHARPHGRRVAAWGVLVEVVRIRELARVALLEAAVERVVHAGLVVVENSAPPASTSTRCPVKPNGFTRLAQEPLPGPFRLAAKA